MRILFTTPFLPFPPIEGGRTIPYRYLEGLAAQGHEITALLPIRRPEDPGHICEIQRFGNVHTVPVAAKTAIRVAWEALVSGESLRVRRHAFRAVEAELERILREESFDLVCLESLFTAYLAPIVRNVAPETPCVLMEQNVESRLFRRMVSRRSGVWTLLGRFESSRIERAERDAARSSTAVVALSEEDAAVLRTMAPHVQIIVQTPGVVTYSGESIAEPPDRDTVLFLGSYHWPPNRDGVDWLLDEVWPKVRRRQPKARLILAGNDPSGEMRALHDPARGIDARGFVDDVSETLREAAVTVVPIRFGSGIRLKILESLANERPTVTTSSGLEGLPFGDNKQVVLADGADTFAAAVVSLLTDEARAGRLAAAGRARVEAEYSWGAVSRQLAHALEEVVNGA